jgi:hypothetical protein
LFGYTAVMPVEVPKKKRSLLPVLTILFVVSYGLMTMLIVEQGAAIQSQRNLIQILMPESRQLWGLRGKAIVDKQKALAQSHTQAPSAQTQVPAQTPSTIAPLTQAPSVQAPSTQAAPQHQSRNSRTARPQAQLPPVPASDLGDQRRALRTI